MNSNQIVYRKYNMYNLYVHSVYNECVYNT